MSHRITTKTKITNKDLAIDAIKMAGWSFQQSGNAITITSGPMNRARLDLRTGNISGDTDWHSKDTLGALRQNYSEAVVRQQCRKTGATVESREVMKDGKVRLIMTANFA